MSRAALKLAKRWLILGHRWLGIATGLFFAVWILSGVVMMHVAFPALTEPERLARMAPIAWGRVAVGPDAALAGIAAPRAVSLAMRGGEPAYQVVARDGARITLSASDGRRLGPVSAKEAIAIAGGGPSASVRAVFRDQWSVTARYDPLRPFHVVALGDEAGTELYVSQATGQIALDATRHERFWNWLGSIPHWIYLTPLRANAELWRDVVLWISGLGVAGAASGLALGFWRLRLRRPYASGAVTPYRGLHRWHHLFGVMGGVTLLSFVASGWLSMNPNRWFSGAAPPAEMRARYEGSGPPVDLAALRGAGCPGAVEMRLARIGGRAILIASDAAGARAVSGAPGVAEIEAAARSALPEARLVSSERLTAHDSYWHPHHEPRPLPILRLAFDDPAATWLHVDPATGDILGRLDRSGRVNRWLFGAAHRLDLAILTDRRPLWDLVVLALSALGAVIALTGIAIGWRRLRRPPRRDAKARLDSRPRRDAGRPAGTRPAP